MSNRETLDVDVLFVGAGPAGLAGAIHLARLAKRANKTINIAVIEKGKEVGAHILSGAVMDPRSLYELQPDFLARGAPIEGVVEDDSIYFMTEKDAIALPYTPRHLENRGNFIISLSKFTRWLAKIAEEEGVQIFTGFAGSSLLMGPKGICGIRTGDKGVDKHGNKKPNFEAGVDIMAKVILLAEGPRGSLYRQLDKIYMLHESRNPQMYATGVKEVWEFPKGSVPPNRVIHTMGWPLASDAFGGGFIYNMKDDKLCIGFVVGLDYRDPFMEPQHEFQRFKSHPKIASLLDGGKMIEYGAKTIPEGGWYAMPKLFVPPGIFLLGDTAGLLDAMRLKGVHMAMKSGMIAAEIIAEAFAKYDFSEAQLGKYESAVKESWIGRELYKSRNFKTGFVKHGFWLGLLNTSICEFTGGRGIFRHTGVAEDHLYMRRKGDYYGDENARLERMRFDDRITFSKVNDVFYSKTFHDEDTPCHLVVPDTDICVNKCTREYGNPCQYFCPANVYEWVGADEGKGRLQINAANCVHCKTCDIMDPYGNILWVVPEGGGGPGYQNL